MKAFWKPSVRASAGPSRSRPHSLVVEVAIEDSAAMPSAPPICCDVLINPEASPASDG